MVTQLSDLVIEPNTISDYISQISAELWDFWSSGIVAQTAEFDEMATDRGRQFEMPTWDDLDADGVDIGSDLVATESTPQDVTSSKELAYKHFRARSWGSADILAAIASGGGVKDPLEHVARSVGRYWSRVMQKATIAIVQGVVADNIANDASDMVNVIGNDSASAITSAELFSADAAITAMATAGDGLRDFAAIGVHSVIYAEMQRQNVITFVEPAVARTRFGTYLGLDIIVDDGLPAVVGSERVLYTTVFFKRGALSFGRGNPKVPFEIDRSPRAGNGTGSEEVHYRQDFILHPRGFEQTFQKTGNALSATNAELALATTWSRVHERKLIPMAFLQTNG